MTNHDPEAFRGFLTARLNEDDDRINKQLDRALSHRMRVREPEMLGREIPGWHDWSDVIAVCKTALLDLSSKRFLMAEHLARPQHPDEIARGSLPQCIVCAYGVGKWHTYPCPTMCSLAAPYHEHPDFQRRWGYQL